MSVHFSRYYNRYSLIDQDSGDLQQGDLGRRRFGVRRGKVTYTITAEPEHHCGQLVAHTKRDEIILKNPIIAIPVTKAKPLIPQDSI
jgi:hypothetical protein